MSLIACGSSGSSDAEDSSELEGGVSGSLLIWEHDYSYEEGIEALIEGFNELYPDVEITYLIRGDGDYDSLLKTALQSGDGPDIFWTNGTATSTMPDLVDNGMIVDLTDVVDMSFISEDALNVATVDEGIYNVPWMQMDTRTCYYNKDMFEQNGWEIPTTFSEFVTLMETIYNSGTTPVSMALDSWCLLFAYEPILAGYDHEYCEGLSDYSVSATDTPVREAMQLMVDWAEAGYYGDNWTGVLDSSSQILAFTTGNAAMFIDGSWDASNISMNNPGLNYGAFAIPSEDGTTGLVGTEAPGFSINTESQNMEAAELFMNYCASKEGQTAWIQAIGGVPSTTEIESSSEIIQEISDSGNGNTYRSWQNVLSNYSDESEASNIWADDFTKIFTGEMTVDELCDEIEVLMQ